MTVGRVIRASVSSPMALATGTHLGRYEIRSKIGAGGMGEVYLAEDTSELKRKVAIKILPAEVAADRQRMQRFVQEAQTTSSLNHPNILTIFEIGEAESMRFIVMEFIDGESLRHRMASTRLDVDDALDIAIQTAAALVASHKARIAHRDIKPENIMVRHDDRIVKILDFGLAKPTEGSLQPAGTDSSLPTAALINTSPGVVLGTVGYMSPEQARGAHVDERTDIWSLGCVLYEMVAGCLPFVGAGKNEVISQVLSKEKAPPLARYAHNVPERLEEIVTKALTKDREERYQTVKDMLIDLKRLKQKREVDDELQRSVGAEGIVNQEIGSQFEKPKTLANPIKVTTPEAPHPTLSVEYIASQIKTHKRGAYIVLGAILIAAAALSYFFYFKGDRTPVLTDKDTILLAEFDNKTGDAVFDGTLRQGLAVQLQQSPFFDIFPDARMRETLRLMTRSPDERVTRELAREICLRQGVKALIAGSIAKFDRNYSITLEALNGQTGESLALTQVEAEGKDQVLKALSRAAAELREKLGESLGSIQKFDAQLESTTSSLDALREYTLGSAEGTKGQYLSAIEYYRRAVEKDPNFASAWLGLATCYNNTNQPGLAAECAAKAFALSGRVSEFEKMRFSVFYYKYVTGELDKAIEAQEAYRQIYPRDHVGPGNLTDLYLRTGQIEKAVAAAHEALLLNPNAAIWHSNLAGYLLRLNRFAEANDVCAQALGKKLDSFSLRGHLYSLAFVSGNGAAMQEQIAWASGKPEEYRALSWQAQTAAFAGAARDSQDLARRATEMAVRNDAKEAGAQYAAEATMRAAALEQGALAVSLADAALKLTHNQITLTRAALALQLANQGAKAQPLVREMEQQYPKDTLVNQLWLPMIKAVLELGKGNAQAAIDLLEATKRYEPSADFWPQTVRAQAYLKLGKGAEAEAEYQKILDHRGQGPLSPLYPLAHLGLARAAILQRDTEKARHEYQEFFTIWKDADSDLPILIEAKKGFEKLK